MERLPLERLLLPTDDDLQPGLDVYKLMVDTIAFSTKAYWAMWGPLGLPMIDAADRWAQRLRGHLQPVSNKS